MMLLSLVDSYTLLPLRKPKVNLSRLRSMYQDSQHIFTSRDFKPRYTGPAVSSMTPEQVEIRDSILKSRPRTGLSGPFGPWLAVPSIANPAQELGRACRYGTSLSFRESELCILLTGAYTKSHAEFDIHVPEAIKAGITMDIIRNIPRDDQFTVSNVRSKLMPCLQDKPREQAIAKFVTELLVKKTVCTETYASTKSALGTDKVLVELTSIVGYYTYVAMTLNVFRIPSK